MHAHCFYNFTKQRVYFVSCVCFCLHRVGGKLARDTLGWVSDPGENSLH